MHAQPGTRRRALLALTGLLASLATAVPAATAAAAATTAQEVYLPAADGSFAVEGHGWGHGRGMSQYGALGAAQQGLTAQAITGFYFPGTAWTTLPASTLRVGLTGDDGADTDVYAATGLTVTDAASGATATLPSGPVRWRAVPAGDGLHLQSLTGSTWSPYALAGRTALTGPVGFGGPTFVRLAYRDGSSRDYRGTVQAVRRSATGLTTVDVLSLEDYLLGVVPRESSSSWPAAALQAQAVAARTYAAYGQAHAASGAAYDVCDSTSCQVFGGSRLYTAGGSAASLEPQSTTDAVHATAGVERTLSGAPVFTEFSSSDGGWTVDGGQPYLPAQQDDYDGVSGSSVHTWTARLTAAELQARYPAVGTLRRLVVTSRDGNGEWGGRVKTVVLEGVDSSGQPTSVSATGGGIYLAHSWPASSDGLRSSWWHVVASAGSTVVSQSSAPTLVQSPGASTAKLVVDLRNSGTAPWQVAGLHLAVASPPGQADPLVGGSTRPGFYAGNLSRPGSSTVAPGEAARFTFTLTGDGVRPGVQSRAYQLRNDSGPLFGTTVAWQVPVQAAVLTATVGPLTDPAGAPSGGAPGAVLAGGRTVVVPTTGRTVVRLTARNAGNLAWPLPRTRIGTSAPHDRTSASYGSDWLGTTRVAGTAGSGDLAPGGSASFDLPLHGGGRPVGVTTESFEPVWDGQAWLSGAAAVTVVRVDPATPKRSLVDSAPPASLSLQAAPSGTAVLRVRLRNVGRDPWTVGAEQLAVDAGTPLSTSAWPSRTRTPALTASVTRPGQSAVWPGEVGEWRVPLSAFHVAPGTYAVTAHLVGTGPSVTTKVTVTAATFAGTLVAVHPSVAVPSAGSTLTWFDVKNTGNTAWPVGGLVRSEVLSSGGSPSRDGSWTGALRPGSVTADVTRPGATSVAPGEVARFAFVLAGNGRTPRTASEPFGVLWEGWTRTTVRAVLAYSVR